MAADPTLLAEPRPRTGSAESRRLRSRGVVPGVVYGHGEGSVGIAVPAHDLAPILQSGHQLVDLSLSGGTQKSIFKEVQYDTWGREVLHFDLQRVSADEEIETEVRVISHGVAPGTEEGGVLELGAGTVEIRCPANAIPDSIDFSVSEMHVDDEIRVGDLTAPDRVIITTDPSVLLAHVIDAEALAARQEARLEDALESDTTIEPELVGGEEDEEDAEEGDAKAKAPAEGKEKKGKDDD